MPEVVQFIIKLLKPSPLWYFNKEASGNHSNYSEKQISTTFKCKILCPSQMTVSKGLQHYKTYFALPYA